MKRWQNFKFSSNRLYYLNQNLYQWTHFISLSMLCPLCQYSFNKNWRLKIIFDFTITLLTQIDFSEKIQTMCSLKHCNRHQLKLISSPYGFAIITLLLDQSGASEVLWQVIVIRGNTVCVVFGSHRLSIDQPQTYQYRPT